VSVFLQLITFSFMEGAVTLRLGPVPYEVARENRSYSTFHYVDV
jgi:hypothetical protein